MKNLDVETVNKYLALLVEIYNDYLANLRTKAKSIDIRTLYGLKTDYIYHQLAMVCEIMEFVSMIPIETTSRKNFLFSPFIRMIVDSQLESIFILKEKSAKVIVPLLDLKYMIFIEAVVRKTTFESIEGAKKDFVKQFNDLIKEFEYDVNKFDDIQTLEDYKNHYSRLFSSPKSVINKYIPDKMQDDYTWNIILQSETTHMRASSAMIFSKLNPRTPRLYVLRSAFHYLSMIFELEEFTNDDLKDRLTGLNKELIETYNTRSFLFSFRKGTN